MKATTATADATAVVTAADIIASAANKTGIFKRKMAEAVTVASP